METTLEHVERETETRGSWGLRLLLVAVIVVVAAIGIPRRAVVETDPAVTKVEDFRLETITGETLRLSEALKKGPVILDFWATWCAPCKRAMPRWAQLQERYAEHGVQLWAVSWDHPRMHSRIAPYFESKGFDFPALLDTDHAVGTRLGVINLPTTFLVSQDGRLIWRHVGFADGDERALETELRRLLALPLPSVVPVEGTEG